MLYDAESCKPSQRADNVSSMTFTWALFVSRRVHPGSMSADGLEPEDKKVISWGAQKGVVSLGPT